MILTNKLKEPTIKKPDNKLIFFKELKHSLIKTFGSEKANGNHLKSKSWILTDSSQLKPSYTWLTCLKKTLSTKRTNGLKKSNNILMPICQEKSFLTVLNTKEDFSQLQLKVKNLWFLKSSELDTTLLIWFISSLQERMKLDVGLSEDKLKLQELLVSFTLISKKVSFVLKSWNMKTS